MIDESRCPNCNALVVADAAWCGQCLASLEAPPGREPEWIPELEPDAFTETPLLSIAPGVAPSDEADRSERGPLPVWECPKCGTENPFDGEVCSACGTPFGRLFQEPKEVTVISPRDAAFAGLIPGMGHYKMGLHADGVVRMFVALGCVLVLGLFAFAASGRASAAITVLFAGMTGLCVWESAYDSFRLASKDRELISAVQLIWVFLGVFGFAVLTVFMMSRAPVSP